MRQAGRGRASAALLVLALASACSAADAPVVRGPVAPRTPAPVGRSWSGCRAVGAFTDPGGGVPTVPTGAVPDGFVPQRAVLCVTSAQVDANGPEGTPLERTATEIAPLLSYLGHPDEPATDGVCSADAWLPPWLFLVDADGRYVAPSIPVDGCGKPLGWYSRRDAMPWLTPAYTDRVARTR